MTEVALKVNEQSKGKKSNHGRSVTRFCEEANIGEDDQLDMAEFILAARYLGNETNEEKLMEVFMDLELGNDDTDQKPKEMIKSLLKKVDGDGANANDQEVYLKTEDQKQSEDHSADIEWQEIQIDGFISNAKQQQNITIAKNLLQTTALTANEIAEITGVDPELLKDYESEEFETDDEDEEEENAEEDQPTQEKTTPAEPNPPPAATTESKDESKDDANGAVVIKSSEYGRSLMLTKQDIGMLEELLNGGEEMIKKKPDTALQLLQKMKKGIDLTPGADKRSKHIKKLKTMATMRSVPLDGVTRAARDKSTAKDKFPAKYRIVIVPGALIKKEKDLQSKEVGKVPIGTVVVGEEVDGRRIRISKPLVGWCSLTSKDGRVICQRENTKSPEMESAIHAERARQTKVLILKSITTLNDVTVERILERSDWNLRRAIEAFYVAKYKTQEYMKTQDDAHEGETPKKKKKKGWFSSWKKFAKEN